MSNLREAKPRVKTITLKDGVEREICFTLNAMAEMEDKYGSVDAAFKKLDEGSVKAARFILWAGLMHADDALTEQQVGDLIDLDLLSEIMDSVSAALGEDMPQESNDTTAVLPNA